MGRFLHFWVRPALLFNELKQGSNKTKKSGTKHCYNKQCLAAASTEPHFHCGYVGCYPVCPEDKPIFDERNQTCVAVCNGCYINETWYDPEAVIPSDKPCTNWYVSLELQQVISITWMYL